MFQIGQHLADRRRRLGLTVAECESATRIRAKYLEAIEDDRLDGLVDRAYARLFIRSYASFLGEDADRIIAEYDHQHGEDETLEHQIVPPEPVGGGRIAELRRMLSPPPRRTPRRGVAWAAIGAVGAIMLLVWAGTRDADQPAAERPAAVATRPAATVPTRAPVTTAPPRRPPAPPPAGVRLALTGIGGSGSYVRIHRGDESGPVVYEGTVGVGQTVHVDEDDPLWMRVGWAPNLRVTLNGRAVTLSGGTGNFAVDRAEVAAES